MKVGVKTCVSVGLCEGWAKRTLKRTDMKNSNFSILLTFRKISHFSANEIPCCNISCIFS